MIKKLWVIAILVVSASAQDQGLPVNIVRVGSVRVSTAAPMGVVGHAVAAATITQSSQTAVSTESRPFFAADPNRKGFEMFALPTNTDYIIGKWGGPASSTDTVIISPGESYFPGVTVSTASFHIISNSGSQVLRGNSYAK